MWDRVRNFYRLLRDMVTEYIRDDGPFLSAGIAFYAFFSLFPLTLISVAILAFLWSSEEALSYTVRLSADFVPHNMVDFLERNVRGLTEDRGTIGVAGVLMLLWSGRQLFRAMELSLHRAWDIPLRRNFLSGNLLAMLLVLLCAGVTFSVGLVSAALSSIQLMLSRLDLPEVAGFSLAEAQLWAWLHSWVVVPLATALIFLLLYIILPSRQVPVAHAVPGAIFSAIAWKLSSLVYLEFIVTFGQKNPLYGSIWGIVGMLVWLYIEAAVFLLGAELVYVYLRGRGLGRKRRR